MSDALFILIVVAFFGLMVLLVKACDHIIGPDALTVDSGEGAARDAAGAPAPLDEAAS